MAEHEHYCYYGTCVSVKGTGIYELDTGLENNEPHSQSKKVFVLSMAITYGE